MHKYSSPEIKEGVIEYSVIIPVYKSEATLLELYQKLVSVMEKISARFEIIFIEDCGGDGSWKIIEKFTQSDSRVRGIALSRNFGQHNALLCGIRAAKGNVIITLDDDLQNPPEEIPKLLHKLAEGFDVVYGVPQRQRHGFLRDIVSQVTKIVLQGAMGVNIARNVSAFRVFRVHLRTAFNNYHGSFVSIDVLLTWGTKRFSAISVVHNGRRFGRSNYTFRTLMTHAFNMITGFSTIPLQFASLVGFLFTFFGLAVLVYVFIVYVFSGGKVQGFYFLASIIAIFSGAQLFALGIVGEYLARMYFRIMEKPAYVIRSFIEQGENH
ncbi:MAG: glycosyltransferase family 2 protein [Candidatus Omnitrophica bacterium]|nr:glycosyltransferase family 2 protein [Candidatus Omnitrophota bacterium]